MAEESPPISHVAFMQLVERLVVEDACSAIGMTVVPSSSGNGDKGALESSLFYDGNEEMLLVEFPYQCRECGVAFWKYARRGAPDCPFCHGAKSGKRLLDRIGKPWHVV